MKETLTSSFLMNPDYCLITNEDEQIEEKQRYRWFLQDKNKSLRLPSGVTAHHQGGREEGQRRAERERGQRGTHFK